MAHVVLEIQTVLPILRVLGRAKKDQVKIDLNTPRDKIVLNTPRDMILVNTPPELIFYYQKNESKKIRPRAWEGLNKVIAEDEEGAYPI